MVRHLQGQRWQKLTDPACSGTQHQNWLKHFDTDRTLPPQNAVGDRGGG